MVGSHNLQSQGGTWLQELLGPGFLRRHHGLAVSTLHIACHLSPLHLLASQIFHEHINGLPVPKNPKNIEFPSLFPKSVSAPLLNLPLLLACSSGPLLKQRRQGPCTGCPSRNTYCGGQGISKRMAEGKTQSRHPLSDIDKKNKEERRCIINTNITGHYSYL